MQVSFSPPTGSGSGDARYPGSEFFASVAWSRLAGAGALRAQVLLPRGLPAGPHSLRLGRESPASQPSPLSVTPPGTSAPPLALAYQAPPSMGFSWQEYWSNSLLQGIFPIQGLNPGLLQCRWILHHLSHQGNPNLILEFTNS